MPDGKTSEIGLRGTLFAEMNDEGQLSYVCEGCEPIVKPGQATEALLKAVTQNVERPPKPARTYTQATPTTASAIAEYLWKDAYPNGAEPSEALRLFSDSIVYEDFNYPEPFTGKAAVTEFVNAFDIPGIEFVPQRISEGSRSCAFTWKVVVNGQDGPQGISFYEVDEKGEVCFIRDIPAPSPRGFRPVGSLATLVDPELRVLSPTKLLSAGLGVGSAGMGLLKPAFAAEARWQAETFGDDAARAAAIKKLDEESGSAPVVIYTYGLSPFSTEALRFLDETSCKYRKIELGPEWFLLDGVGAALRAELLARTGQSSLPHVFVGGKSIGGLYSGTPGLAELKKQGKLTAVLSEAGAL
jgi:glutaredoxin